MGSIDAEILLEVPDYMVFNEIRYEFRNLNVQEYIKLQTELFQIINMQIFTVEDAYTQEDMIDNLIIRLFKTESPIPTITVDHLTLLNNYLSRLDLHHQGFSEREIDKRIKESKREKYDDKYEIGPLMMLHKMSELRGWSHEYMMNMDKRVFYRYYGYWYQDCLREEEAAKRAEKEREQKSKNNDTMANLRATAQGG